MEETRLVILPGKYKKRATAVGRIFAESEVKCEIKQAAAIDESETGIFLCDFVPEYPKLIKKLHLLAESGNPIISLYQLADSQKKRYDFILYMPLLTRPTVMRQLIRWLGAQERSSLMFRSALDQLETRKREMVRELALASELQKSLLPKKFPTDIPFNFTHKYVPHEYVGGDFFDVIKIDDKRVGIIIADASGHGASAACIIAMLKILLNHHAPGEPSPSMTLEKINNELCVMIQEHFITAFYAVIDLGTLECRYCNAGHPKQLLISKSGTITDLGPNGFLIGMFDHVHWEEKAIALSSGDKLFCYTDGVIEVTNDAGIQFGYDRLSLVVEENKSKDIVQMSSDVLSHIIMYMKGTTFPDDVTIFIAEVIEDI